MTSKSEHVQPVQSGLSSGTAQYNFQHAFVNVPLALKLKMPQLFLYISIKQNVLQSYT